MFMMKDYIVVQSGLLKVFLNEVNSRLEQGYIPLGGVATIRTDNIHYMYVYTQAMAKYNIDESETFDKWQSERVLL